MSASKRRQRRLAGPNPHAWDPFEHNEIIAAQKRGKAWQRRVIQRRRETRAALRRITVAVNGVSQNFLAFGEAMNRVGTH
ncbi:MAG: hypothetical protein ABWX92_07130 [Mycetocola sp.]